MRVRLPSLAYSLLGFAFLGCIAGCNASDQLGELGNGSFSYDCDSATVCNTQGAADEFPAGIATGSTFRVSFDNFKAKSAVRLEPISPSYLTKRGDDFVAIREGFGGIAAFDRNDDVIDYLFVKLEKPSGLRVSTLSGDARDATSAPVVITGSTGTRELRVRPRARDGRDLGGVLAFEWTAADPAVVAIDFDRSDSSFATLRAAGTGRTKVTVVGAALETTFDVEVQ